ncbi:MAG: hypothetical protein WCS73_01140 [Lentisphaeria bacterium]
MMISLFFVNTKIEMYTQTIKEKKAESQTKISGGEVLPTLDLSGFNGVGSIKDKRNLIDVISHGFSSRSGLFTPAPYVLCKSEKCNHLVNIKDDICPFCKTEFDPIAKETTMDDDTDNDGIPDLIEQKYRDFLNFLNPDDGFMDKDEDGFLNNEEYVAGTLMNDAESFPDLALLLRKIRIFKRRIPFVFSNLRTVESDNKKDWKIMLTAGNQTLTKQLEDSVDGFKLLDINEGQNILTIQSSDKELYQMPLRKPVLETKFSAYFVFLASRNRNDIRILLRRFAQLKRNGEVLELNKKINGNLVTQYYKLNIETPEIVKIGKLDASKEKIVVEYTIPKLNIKKDFELSQSNRSDNGIEENGRRPPGEDRRGTSRRSFRE